MNAGIPSDARVFFNTPSNSSVRTEKILQQARKPMIAPMFCELAANPLRKLSAVIMLKTEPNVAVIVLMMFFAS
jgi:hypothetical protein